MAQADSKNSITAPIDTTRRRFLTVAAIGSMVGAGSLAAAAMAPNDVPRAVTVPRHSRPDPAFALIADKRAAYLAHGEAIDAQDAADERGIGVDEAADRCDATGTAVNAIDWRLATTSPMTLAGIAAVLRFADEHEDAGGDWPSTDTIGADGWHYQLRATMAAAIEAVDQGPGRKGGAVMKRTKKQKTPAKKPVSKKSAIIAQCVVYAQSMGAYNAGFKVDHTGDSDHAGCQGLGGTTCTMPIAP